MLARNVLESRRRQRDAGRVGADLDADAARLLGRAEADGVAVGEQHAVDDRVGVAADLRAVVARLATLLSGFKVRISEIFSLM